LAWGGRLRLAERRRLDRPEDELQDRVGEKVTGLGVLELTRGVLRFHLVCPEGVTRNSALDYPVYPEIVEARERLVAR